MKICIISTVAPRHMSMYSIYTTYFRNNIIDYDLIYMDRFGGSDAVEATNTFRFEIKNDDKISKYRGYLSFPAFVKKIVRLNQYDFLIVWNELTGVLLGRYLCKNYKNKYILNIRDLFDERNVVSYRLLNGELRKAIDCSYLNTVSSEKYIDYLPKSSAYTVIHSLNPDYQDVPTKKRASDKAKINVMYIGNIRFLNKLKSFIRAIKDDDRFMITVAGSGSEQVEDFCREIGYKNGTFIGTFDSHRTTEIISDADILYNLYGTEYECLRTALSQKLYLSITNVLPILVYNNTYMYEVANECGIAFGVDDKTVIEHSVIDDLYQWYCKISWETVEQKCKRMSESFKLCNLHFEDLLDNLFLNEK